MVLMILYGKWTYLKNHTFANLKKMFHWSKDPQLVEIECGNPEKCKLDKDTFSREVMTSYIENGPETHSSFSHFGIHLISNDELVGYADLQDIDDQAKMAEASISIPEINLRGYGMGFDAFLSLMNYSFRFRKLERILIKTKASNMAVRSIIEKLELPFQITEQVLNHRHVDLCECILHRSDFHKMIEARSWE